MVDTKAYRILRSRTLHYDPYLWVGLTVLSEEHDYPSNGRSDAPADEEIGYTTSDDGGW